MENNKLIVEFMGLKPKMESPDVYVFSDMPYFSVRENNPEDAMNAIVKYSKYDSDWNWLMKVVEKIENYNEFTDVLFAPRGCAIDCYIENGFSFSNDCDTKIEAVYNACVEFIKWYNLTKKYIMQNITLSEEELKVLLKNAFIQGEKYQENWSLEQIGEVDEVTEKDFGEWYSDLDLTEFKKK